jgi:hypothetical protein
MIYLFAYLSVAVGMSQSDAAQRPAFLACDDSNDCEAPKCTELMSSALLASASSWIERHIFNATAFLCSSTAAGHSGALT